MFVCFFIFLYFPCSHLLSPLAQSDGCLAHLTGVAASSLAVHLHSLLSTSQSRISVAVAPPAPNAVVSPPSDRILPPPPQPGGSATMLDRGGYAVNMMLFRGDVHSGLNRWVCGGCLVSSVSFLPPLVFSEWLTMRLVPVYICSMWVWVGGRVLACLLVCLEYLFIVFSFEVVISCYYFIIANQTVNL